MAEQQGERWRTGTSPGTHGRTIYRHVDSGPERGELIGLMDTPELATQVVDAVNGQLAIIERDRLRAAVDAVLQNWAHVRDHIGSPDNPISALYDQVAEALRASPVEEVPENA